MSVWLRLIWRRLLTAVGTLLIVSVVVFLATEILPGDIAQRLAGRGASEETIQSLRNQFGLDRPAPIRYLDWLTSAGRGDLGQSLASGEAIGPLVADRFKKSLLLGVVAAAMGIPFALFFGVVAGMYRDRFPDVIVSGISLITMSLPQFVAGSFLILLFAVTWNVFPAVGTAPVGAPVRDLIPNVWLPSAALTSIWIAYVIRLVRASTIEVLRSDFVETATLKGLSRRRIVFRHVLPSAMTPSVSALALVVGWLIGGAVVVEVLFNYPGIGRLTALAVQDRDLPLVQALALIGATLYVTVNLLADILTMILNPSLRSARS